MTGTFVESFLQVCASQPESTAVEEAGAGSLRYLELLQRSLTVAGALRSQGIGRGDVVALMIPKSIDYLVSLLGTWCAGAAFLPLDPATPPERRRTILSDAKPAAILTRSSNLSRAAGSTPVVVLDQPAVPLDRPVDVDLSAPAYLIYTSGSMGRPKGVNVSHRGIVPVLSTQIDAFRLSPTSRVLFYLSTSFDASISDLGTALLSGATLHIEPGIEAASIRNLIHTLERRRITHLDLPPSLLRLVVEAGLPASLETLIIGGEPCSPETVRVAAARVRVVNVYGPSEATICTSLVACDPATWTRPLIGAPIPTARYRVEGDGEGELLIGGPCLADGYHQLPDETEARFVLRDGSRWFRTGDRVKVHERGELEFVGRIDRQVKLNGKLVAPEEVESALLALPNVIEAVVIPEQVGGRLRLTAHVVQAIDEGSAEDLASALAEVLPSWMIPTRWELRRSIPRTVSGKFDRQGLGSESEQSYTEAILLRFARHVLRASSLSSNDDLIERGLDSVGILELAALAESTGLSLEPSLIGSCRTIAELAARHDDHLHRASRRSASWLLADLGERELLPPAEPMPPAAAHVFVTGATGFLGSHLVAELLRSSQARLHCVVRGGGESDVKERVLAALAAADPSMVEQGRRRIEAHAGDIEREHLGLDAQPWSRLQGEVDTVIHCAAAVDLARPYEHLRAANVEGTWNVLALLDGGRSKRFHLVSTLAVLLSSDRGAGETIFESDDLSHTQWISGGYAQSKWAAEMLVRRAAVRAGAVTIHRLGLLGGHSQTGRSAERDWLSRFIRGLAHLRSLPETAPKEISFDFTPVDWAATAIAQLVGARALTSGDQTATYHITSSTPVTLAELCASMGRLGVPVRGMSDDQFRLEVKECVLSGRSLDAASALMALQVALQPSGDHRTAPTDLFLATGTTFEKAEADRILRDVPLPPLGSVEARLDAAVRWILRGETR